MGAILESVWAQGLTVVTGPTEEPVTVQEVKDWCFITHVQDDDLLRTLVKAARDAAELFTSRALITQTRKLTTDIFPVGGCFLLPFPPLQSVTSVKYYDTDDVLQTVSSALYGVDTTRDPGRLVPVEGTSWESPDLRLNAVEITYVCGYGNSYAVPERFKQAIKLYVKHAYDNREVMEAPVAFYRLIQDYRVWI